MYRPYRICRFHGHASRARSGALVVLRYFVALFSLLLNVTACSLAADDPVIIADESSVFDRNRFTNLPLDKVAILEELFNDCRRLKRFYCNLAMTAQVHSYRMQLTDGIRTPSSSVKLERVKHYDYRSRGGEYFRLDFSEFEPDGKTPSGAGRGVISPDESYLFSRDLKTQQLVVIRHGKDVAQFMSMLQSTLVSVLPYSFGPVPLEYELFAREDANIVSIETAGDGRNATATIVRKIVVPNVGENTTRFELLRGRHWAVSNIDGVTSKYLEGKTKATDRYLQKCEYSDSATEFPLLKSAVYEIYGDDESAVDPPMWSKQIVTVTNVSTFASDETDFDVGKMMSKIELLKERASSKSWYLLANGIALIMIGLFLARRYGQKQL